MSDNIKIVEVFQAVSQDDTYTRGLEQYYRTESAAAKASDGYGVPTPKRRRALLLANGMIEILEDKGPAHLLDSKEDYDRQVALKKLSQYELKLLGLIK